MHRFSYSFLPHTKDPKNAYFRAFWQKVFRTAFCIKPFNRFLPFAVSWTSLGIRVNLRFLFVLPLIGISTLLPMPRVAFSALFGMMGGGLLVGKGRAQFTQPSTAGVVHATMRSADAWITTVSQFPRKQQLAAVRQRGASDALLRPAKMRVCYLAVQLAPPVASPTVPIRPEPRPKGIRVLCVMDGRPIYAPVSADLERVMEKSVKKLTFRPSSMFSVLFGSLTRGGAVIITTTHAQTAASSGGSPR